MASPLLQTNMADLSQHILAIQHALVADADNAVAALEEVARHSLEGYELHHALLKCPGLVAAVVGHISCCSRWECAAGFHNSHGLVDRLQQQQQCEVSEAALEAAISLTVSKEGAQAMIGAGAIDAACSVLLLSCCYHGQLERNGKQQRRVQDADVAAASTADDHHDLLDLALQLLAALVLSPSAARPSVGALNPQLSATTAQALIQVLPGAAWQLLDAKRRLDAVAVLMRLAMEPGVIEHVCKSTATAETGDSAAHTATGTGCTQSPSCSEVTGGGSNTPQATGLACLLGHGLSQEQFVAEYWEVQPVVCRGALYGYNSTTIAAAQQHDTTQQPRAFQLHLTPGSVFEQLLPIAVHCPILAQADVETVQVLHDLHATGCLLQQLQLNSDLRLIKTQTLPITAAQHAGPCTPQATHHHTPQCLGRTEQPGLEAPPCDQTTARGPGCVAGQSAVVDSNRAARSVTQEVLCELDGAVTGPSCLAACHAGFSLSLRDMPKRHPAVGLLVQELETQLGLPAGANLYLTPAGRQGLQAHYDDHDVFVLQLSGSKLWLIGPPQHQPLPLAYQQRLPVVQLDLCCPKAGVPDVHLQAGHPAEPQACCSQLGGSEAEHPVATAGSPSYPQHVLLQAGDCLYLPRGWVHQAAATGTESEAAQPASDPGVGQLPSASCSCGPLVGSSLHLSVGLEVDAVCSVQGFLHHIVDWCAGRVCAAEHCRETSSIPATTPLEPCHPLQRLPSLAIRAAALLLHMQLWRNAQVHSLYRRACPLLATGSVAQCLSRALEAQLRGAYGIDAQQMSAGQLGLQEQQGAAVSEATGPVVASAAGCPVHSTAASTQLQQGELQQMGTHPWVLHALQHLCSYTRSQQGGSKDDSPEDAPDSTACSSIALLWGLIRDLLPSGVEGAQLPPTQPSASGPPVDSTDPLDGAGQTAFGHGDGQPAASGTADGLVQLSSWLDTAASSSVCRVCCSSACHSVKVCACAVLAVHMAGLSKVRDAETLESMQLLLEQHVGGCRCCAEVVFGTTPADEEALLRAASSSVVQTGEPSEDRITSCDQGSSGLPSTTGAGKHEVACGLLQESAMHVDQALAAMTTCLCVDGCVLEAAAVYVQTAKARVACCKAMRSAFLAAAALNQLL